MTFTETERKEEAEARLSRMGRESEKYEKSRNCCELFKCKDQIWREYMKQDKHGEKWLVTLLLI